MNALPLVLVFDRNLECITREGADDVIKMTALGCRNYWVEQLLDQKGIVREGQDDVRMSDDD